MREHKDEPGRVERGDRGVGVAGERDHAGLDDAGQGGQQQHAEGPAGHSAGHAETDSAETEVRTEAQPDAVPEIEQHDSLQYDPQRGTPGQNGDHGRRELGGQPGAVRVGTVERREDEQARDRHDVVQHGNPGEGAERLAGVENFTQDRVQAVEEDLRQAPERECRGQGQGLRLHVRPVEQGQ